MLAESIIITRPFCPVCKSTEVITYKTDGDKRYMKCKCCDNNFKGILTPKSGGFMEVSIMKDEQLETLAARIEAVKKDRISRNVWTLPVAKKQPITQPEPKKDYEKQ